MKTLVIIPLYNERPTLAAVLQELRRHYRGDVLLVDDGSDDGSVESLDASSRAGLEIMSHPRNLGYGASLMSGFKHAIEGRYDLAISMDCDFQHEPAQVPEFIELAGRSDVISGSRYLRPSLRDQSAPPDRRRINGLITEHINVFTGYGITDAFCGFKAYRPAALEPLRLDEPGYGFPLQFWVQAKAFGLTVSEIPVARIYKNVKRTFGQALDDPETRLRYYEQVITREIDRWKQML